MNKYKIIFAFISILFIQNISWAQIDTLDTDAAINQSIEDVISNTEVDEDVDFSYLSDQLEHLHRHPINLNTANKEDLSQLPGFNELIISSLQKHIKDFGKLTTIYELQAVEGFSTELIQAIMPYVVVRSGSDNDLNVGKKHAAGPSISEVFGGLKTELTQRIVFIAEDQKGYSDPDTTFRVGDNGQADTSLSSRYLGSHIQSYTRLRMRYGQNFSFGITGEKDKGEAWNWDPKNKNYGYDYLSAHISIKNYGSVKSLVLGDYTLQFGQGLIFSRGLGFGKGADVIGSVKQKALGIRPYSSVNENQFLRGVATTLAFGDFYFTAFASRVKLDGSAIASQDTIGDVEAQISSIRLGGFHRTESELLSRRSLDETSFGGRIEYRSRSLKIGISEFVQKFGGNISPKANAYNQFDFRGNQNTLTGVDFDWSFENVNVFGEAARSRSGGIAAMGGMMSSLSAKLDFSLVARSFDKDFHSFKGYTFAERPTGIQNERGLYMGLKLKASRKWEAVAYFDQYYFKWNKFQAYFPSRGYEYLFQIQYKPQRHTRIYFRFRSDNKEVNAKIAEAGQQVQFLIPARKLQFRLHFQTQFDRKLSLRSRVEFSNWLRGHAAQPEERANGFLIYQDFIWKIGYKLKISARYAIFDAKDYDARIYAYENDVLGYFSIPPYNGTGSRFYLILNYKPVKGLEFWARVAQTRIRNPEINGTGYCCGTDAWQVFGSGLEEIKGDHKTEIKLQMRLKF